MDNKKEISSKKRQTETKKLLLEQLRKTPVVQLACERVGIGRATYYRWRQQSKKFTDEADKAIFDGSLLINDMAESQLMAAIKDRHMTGIIFWLRNHHPAYTDKLEVMAHLKTPEDDKLTPKQQTLIAQALKMVHQNKEDINQ